MPYGIRKEGTGKVRISSGRSFSALFLLFVALLAFAAAAGLWRAGKAFFAYLARESRYDKIIVEAGRRNGVDPCLIKAVIWRESKFNAREKGGKGEIGLMQVIPLSAASDWAKSKRFTPPSAGALYDPELNIEIGSWYLGRALRRWRNFKDAVPLALCEYNAGLARTKKWQPETGDGDVISRIGIDSTKRYVKDILKRYRKYKEEWKIPQ